MTAHRPIALPPNATPITIADQPAPMLEWVEIARMVIDDSYQRPINVNGWKTIRKIAENFSLSCFTPVQIAPTQDGRFAVIDGQHRVHAALMCGLDRVPAMIVPIAVTEQAKAFIQVNTARTGVSQFNLYRAALASGQPWALQAQAAVATAGCRLMTFTPSTSSKKPGDILSVGLIREMVTKGHARAVTVALTALRAIEDTVGNAAVVLYSDFVINPLIKAASDFPEMEAETLTAILRKRRLLNVIESAHHRAKAEHKAPSAMARQAIALMIRQHGTAVAA